MLEKAIHDVRENRAHCPETNAQEAEDKLIAYAVRLPFIFSSALEIILEADDLEANRGLLARITCLAAVRMEQLIDNIINTPEEIGGSI